MDPKPPTIPNLEPKPNSIGVGSEYLNFKSLFEKLANKYGKEQLLKYIENNSDVVPVVVLSWLNGSRITSLGVRKIILNTLRNFRLGDLPELPTQQDIPKLVPEKIIAILPEEIIKEVTPKPKKKSLEKEDEAKGRYEGLNLYESDLLDYLKSVFTDLEFNIQDIKFKEKKVRKHYYLFQHLAYICALGYIKGPYERNGIFYYKIK
ncbi:MAG: hypothetical protein WC884_02475 [Candidatus Paceibacterota bacterium]